MQLTKVQTDILADWARECYPQEMCGFLTSDYFIPCENISETPESSFKIAVVEYINWFPKIVAVVHSHTREGNKVSLSALNTPSYEDYLGQQRSHKPWIIVGCVGSDVSEPLVLPRVPSREYIGRKFQWFISDCYHLIQDFYRFELDIILKDGIITEDYSKIGYSVEVFRDLLEDFGFKEVPLLDLQENDILLLDNGMLKGNHIGIYTNGKILHQDLVSCLVPFENFLGRVNKVLRYVKD